MADDDMIDTRAELWAVEIALRARVADRMTKAEIIDLAKAAFSAGYREAEAGWQGTRIACSRERISLGEGNRRIEAFVFEYPYRLIEMHSEPGAGALTPLEAKALSEWLAQRAREIEPAPRRHGSLRRLLRGRR